MRGPCSYPASLVRHEPAHASDNWVGIYRVFDRAAADPDRPCRENATSMSNMRRNVWARHNRPATARGFFAHDGHGGILLRILGTDAQQV
jgi:hypothetical protein